jgi:hypothetical protein
MNERENYLQDLEFWLWITKGARFSAHERCLTQNKWSNLSIGILSAYIIIINLVTIFKFSDCPIFNANFISFISTALSILILVFSQLENSNDFKLKAEKFHNCAREVAKVYRDVRNLKRMQLSDEELQNKLNQHTAEYEGILDKYENHEELDYMHYKVSHPEDFPMTDWNRFKFRVTHYISSIFVYHLLIIVPPILFVLFWNTCNVKAVS